MSITYDSQEALDRIVLLLATVPREGWEDIYEAITKREVERLVVPAEERDDSE